AEQRIIAAVVTDTDVAQHDRGLMTGSERKDRRIRLRHAVVRLLLHLDRRLRGRYPQTILAFVIVAGYDLHIVSPVQREGRRDGLSVTVIRRAEMGADAAVRLVNAI